MAVASEAGGGKATAQAERSLRRRLGDLFLRLAGWLGSDAVVLAELSGAANFPCLLTDAEGTVIIANRAYHRFADVGSSAPGLFEILPEAKSKLESVLGEINESGQARFMVERQGPTGATQWLNISATRLDAPKVRIAWYIDDVSAQQHLSDHHAAERLQLGGILDGASIGCCIVDDQDRLLACNQTFAGWLAPGLEAIDLGTPIAELAELDGGFTISRQEETHCAIGDTREARLRLQDGRVVDVVAMQSVSQDLVSGARQTLSVLRNLSLEREHEAALALAEARFQRFFDYAPVAVATVDGAGRISDANPAFRGMVLDGGEVLGRPLAEFIIADDRDSVAQLIGDARIGVGLDASREVRLDPARMGERLMQLYLSRLEDESGAGSGLLLHFMDTTEQRNLEAQFAQSQKMQAVGQLAGGVAHDFNNLLTAIIGHTDLLMLRFHPGDEAFPDMMQIKQNANRAANLIRQLLAFSRRQTLRPKVLSMTDVLAELTHLLRRLIGENIELRVVHGRDLHLVEADQNQLEQVIINLAVNARDAMTTGGVLEIVTDNVHHAGGRDGINELMPQGDYAHIRVSDNGSGIAKADLEKIFEPFFTTKEPGAGTGLGLATVYGIVKQTGGFIFADSDVGQSTTFDIYLPAHQPERVETTTVPVAEANATARDLTGNGTVLLVEDEDAVRIFAVRALRNKGYEVLDAPGGEAALELLAEHDGTIDLIISDVVMPQMDGPTLIKQIRAQRPDIKVIFISGYAESAFRQNLDLGVDYELLPKPFSLKELAGKVKEVMVKD